MAEHVHPLDIPKDYYKPIGQIAAGWNLTEALIQSAIWHLHGITNPKIGRMFTYRPSSTEKLKIFKLTLNKFVIDLPLKSEMKAIYDEASDLRGERNTIVHGLWGRMPAELKNWKVFFLKDTDDTYRLQRLPFDHAKLVKVATRVRRLNVRLSQFLDTIGAPPP
jgi:hypothetical protein